LTSGIDALRKASRFISSSGMGTFRWTLSLATAGLRNAAGFIRHHALGAFRSTLFLAAVMVILDHFSVLEWLDVFMLRLLPAAALHTAKADPAKPAKALVFTIQEELFETEFKSRSPIDRAVLKKHLEKLLEVYPDFRILAIDYDLSPNSTDPTEQDAQAALDTFLVSLVKSGKQVVLITHLRVVNRELCRLKIAWETTQYENGILFGDPALWHYNLFGVVVKFAERRDSFPAIALAAANGDGLPDMREHFTCPDPGSSSRQYVDQRMLQRINFSQAVGSVPICGLYERSGFEHCKDLLGRRLDTAEVIFFGGHYGRDDVYRTPLGETPGVAIQAYTYFSMLRPLETMTHWLALGIDIVWGIATGLIFHWIWQMFHNYRQQGKYGLEVILASMNFVFLIGVFAALVFLTAPLLARGLWINPALMFIGLFIDGYVAGVTATGAGGSGGVKSSHGPTSALYELIGIPGRGVSGWDHLFLWSLKIAVYWITVGMALYVLWTHH
jgi:CHASE2 domain